MDQELEEQMKMLEGLGVEDTQSISATPVFGSTVETAETLRGEVPFIPENPTNKGVVTNSIQPVVNTIQNQVNAQAAAQVVQPTGIATPVNNYTVQQPVVNTNPAPAVDLDAAPVFVNLAATTYQTKTDFLTLKDGEKSRVTLANLNFIRTHIHFIEGLGKIKCLSTFDENDKWPAFRAACCKFIDDKTGKEVNPKNRLLVPVIEYPVSKADGKTVVQGAQPKLKMWDMNYVEEKALMGILENYKTGEDWSSIDINSFDIAISKSKTGEYSTIGLTPMPSWRANFAVGINAELAKINQEFYNDAYKECARVVTEDKVIAALNKKNEAALAAQQIANQSAPQFVDLNM